MNIRKYTLHFAVIFAALGVSLASLANAAVLNLSTAPTGRNSVENGTNTAPKAFDGLTNTRWATTNTTGDNAWIWVDFGADYSLQTIAIQWEAADANTYKLYSLSSAQATAIGWSGGTGTPTYASNWTEIASVANARDNIITAGVTDTFNFVNQTVDVSNRTGSTPVPALSTSISSQPLTRYLLINSISDFDTNGGTSIWEVTVDAITPVPEPKAALLGALGVLLLLRRRR